MVAKGDKVRIHYVGTFDDGTEFDNSYRHGELLEFVVGGGHVIVGLDRAVSEMEVGEKRSIHVEPEEGYGEHRADFVEQVPCEYLPDWEQLPVGEPIVLTAQGGQQIDVFIQKVEDGVVYLDHNHFLAGRALNFDLELVEVLPGGEGEHAHEHAHGDDCGCGCHEHAHEHAHGDDCGCGCHEHAHAH